MDASNTAPLGVRDPLPHFRVRTVDAREIDYAASLWQHSNIVLISLAENDAARTRNFVDEVGARAAELGALHAVPVVTFDAITRVPRPSVLIADRWGEIQTIAAAGGEYGWPAVDDLIDWVRYIEMQCPECQGEAR